MSFTVLDYIFTSTVSDVVMLEQACCAGRATSILGKLGLKVWSPPDRAGRPCPAALLYKSRLGVGLAEVIHFARALVVSKTIVRAADLLAARRPGVDVEYYPPGRRRRQARGDGQGPAYAEEHADIAEGAGSIERPAEADEIERLSGADATKSSATAAPPFYVLLINVLADVGNLAFRRRGGRRCRQGLSPSALNSRVVPAHARVLGDAAHCAHPSNNVRPRWGVFGRPKLIPAVPPARDIRPPHPGPAVGSEVEVAGAAARAPPSGPNAGRLRDVTRTEYRVWRSAPTSRHCLPIKVWRSRTALPVHVDLRETVDVFNRVSSSGVLVF